MLEKQPMPRHYDLETEQKDTDEQLGNKKQSDQPVKKLTTFADLFLDFFRFVGGSKKHGEEVREDIIKIEKQRRKEKAMMAKERMKRENIAKRNALRKKEGELLKQKVDNQARIDERRNLELNPEHILNNLLQQKNKAQTGDEKINFLENFQDEDLGIHGLDGINATAKKTEDQKPKMEFTDNDFKQKKAEQSGFFNWLSVLFKKQPKDKQVKEDKSARPEVSAKVASTMFKLDEKTTTPDLKNVDLSEMHEPEIKPVSESKPAPVLPKVAPQPFVKQQPAELEKVEKAAPAPMIEPHTNKEKATQHFVEERVKLAKERARTDVEERPWHPYNIIKANLIKDQQFVFFNWQRKILLLMLYVFFAILISGFTYGGLLIWDNQKKQDNQYIFDNLDNINDQIVKEQSTIDNILAFSDKLSLVSFILDNHIYWSEFFKFLEDYTLKNVYYESFYGDLNGTYQVPAVARDFDSIYRQLKLMQLNDKVLSVDTEGAKTDQSQATGAADTGDVETETAAGNKKFMMDLSVNPKIFLKLGNSNQ
jgi:hypothetical protein